MSHHRLITLLLVAGLLAGLAAPSAQAKKRPERGLDARFFLDLVPQQGTQVPTTDRITLSVPKDVHVAGSKLPSCKAEVLDEGGEKACPKGAKVGSGTAKATTLGVTQNITMTMWNGPGGKTLLVHVLGFSPVAIDLVMQGIVTRPGGKFGQQLDFILPENLVHPIPGATAGLFHLDATMSGKIGWLRSTSCPPTGWSVRAALSYEGGASLATGADLSCKKVQRSGK
jgi:hypothetical protein